MMQVDDFYRTLPFPANCDDSHWIVLHTNNLPSQLPPNNAHHSLLRGDKLVALPPSIQLLFSREGNGKDH